MPLLLLDAGKPLDIFDVVEVAGGIARVRTAFLFELGEELMVRLDEKDYEARVRAHIGTGPDKITELELSGGS